MQPTFSNQRRPFSEIEPGDISGFLQEARHGAGLTGDGIIAWLAGRGISIDADHGVRLLSEFETATSLITNTRWRRAIRNALGFDKSGGNLTERRIAYLAREEVSLSTLIRHENAGADKTADALRAMNLGGATVDGANLDQIMEMLIAMNRRICFALDRLEVCPCRVGT